MSDHLYITFNINTGRLLDTDTRKIKRIVWSFSKFDADLFQSTFIWECSKEDVTEKYQHSPKEVNERIDEIIRTTCDLAMPRQSNKFRKTDSMY